jgi:hypothetical protein
MPYRIETGPAKSAETAANPALSPPTRCQITKKPSTLKTSSRASSAIRNRALSPSKSIVTYTFLPNNLAKGCHDRDHHSQEAEPVPRRN